MSGTKRISALTELASGSVDEDDILAIVDMSQASVTDKTKHVKVKNLIAVGGRLEIDSFAELATKFVGSSPSSTQQIAATNDIVVWREKGFRYQCVTSGEHLDYTGSGGLKWKVLPGPAGYDFEAWGPDLTGATAATSKMSQWLALGGSLTLPAGTILIDSTLSQAASARVVGKGIGKTIIQFTPAVAGDTFCEGGGVDDWAWVGVEFRGPGRDTGDSEICFDLTSNPDASEIRFKFEACKFVDWNKAGLLISAAWGGEAERCYFQTCGDTTDIAGGSALTETGGIVFLESNSTSGWAGSGFVSKSNEFTSCSYGIYNDKGWNVVSISDVFQYCAFDFFKSAAGTPMVMIAPWMEDFGSPALYQGPVIEGDVIQFGGRSSTGSDNPKLRIYDPDTAVMDFVAYSGTQDCYAAIEATRHDVSTGASKLRFKTTTTGGTKTNWWEIGQDGHFDPITSDTLDIGSPTAKVRNATLGGYLGLGDGVTAPSTVSGVAYIYVDTADGDLKVKFGDGTVKTIVTDT